MIQVDISNIWGQLSLPDLLGIEAEVVEAHRLLLDGGYPEGPEELLGWGFENPVWLYAGVRNLMLRHGRTEEILVHAGQEDLAAHWQKLFGGSLAQSFTPGRGDSFETVLCTDGPLQEALQHHADEGHPVISIDWDDPQELSAFFRYSKALSDGIQKLFPNSDKTVAN